MPDVSVELARSAAVNMLVVGEVVYLLNTRACFGSALSRHGVIGSRTAWLAIATVLLLQLLWTHVPAKRWLFGSDALAPADWGLIGRPAWRSC